ncbi:hypothetical protein [uncultured Gammaproteobacteria bacterium]|nr:hypothetical protein [uncultured Gammaproteobacteria bacterium]
MIIDKDTSPTKDIYYLGAKLLEVLDSYKSNAIDLFQVFLAFNEKIKISMSLFTLTLDWLFILGSIRLNDRKIIKCF